jgi:lia operon protein LiaG
MVMMLTASAYGYRYDDTVKRSFPLNPEAAIHLKSLRGNIEISTHSDNEVNITAVVMADEIDELEKVNIQFDTKDDTVTIYASGTGLEANVSIDYILKVPEAMKNVKLTSQIGEIKSRGTYKNIDFKSGNGEIDFRGSFTRAGLDSANGDIDVYVKRKLKGDLTARTANGDITVELRSSSDFTVNGSTSTGSIRCDFRSITKTDPFGSKITGTVNDGTYRLQLDSVNGDIKVLRQ